MQVDVIQPVFNVGTFPVGAGDCCCGDGEPPTATGCCCYCDLLPSVLTLTFTSGPWGTEQVTLTHTTSPTGGGSYAPGSRIWQGTTSTGDTLTVWCLAGTEVEYDGVVTFSAWIWWCDPANSFEFYFRCNLTTGAITSDTGYGGIGGSYCNVGTVGSFDFEITATCSEDDCLCPSLSTITSATSSLVGALTKYDSAASLPSFCPECPPQSFPSGAIWYGTDGDAAVWLWASEEEQPGGEWECASADSHPTTVYHTVLECCDSDDPRCGGSCTPIHTQECCEAAWDGENYVLYNSPDVVTFS